MPKEQISLEEYRKRQQEASTHTEHESSKYPKTRGGRRQKLTKEIIEIKRILKLNPNHKHQHKLEEKLKFAKIAKKKLKKQSKISKQKKQHTQKLQKSYKTKLITTPITTN